MAEVEIGSVPFAEAIEFFRRKLNITTKRWDELLGAVHSKAFTVAGATQDALLDDLRADVQAAIDDGESIGQFRKRFDQSVEKHGWEYKGSRGWRTRIIYDTNMRSAHAAGRWEQIQRTKERRPYLEYLTVGDARVRPEHARWDSIILPIDDPFWDTHYPPNGWGCRCTVRTLNDRQLKRAGKTVGSAPKITTRERVNTSTGEVYGNVPDGIDTGWDYNVGKSWLNDN